MITSILEFAKSMQHKIDKNEHKECDKMNPDGKGRTWKNCDIYWLLYRLRQETLELEKAMSDLDSDGIIKECADVGNFAMMIHDITLGSEEKQGKET